MASRDESSTPSSVFPSVRSCSRVKVRVQGGEGRAQIGVQGLRKRDVLRVQGRMTPFR
jgi:hypothetical protein